MTGDDVCEKSSKDSGEELVETEGSAKGLGSLEPVRIEKESILECTECGWTTSADWEVDFEEDAEFYEKLLEDHEFMCKSDVPYFRVKNYREQPLVRLQDVKERVMWNILNPLFHTTNKHTDEDYAAGYQEALQDVCDKLNEISVDVTQKGGADRD